MAPSSWSALCCCYSIPRITFLSLLFHCVCLSSSLSVETRRAILRPWSPSAGGNKEIGWTVEERDSGTKAVKQVTVGWNGADEALVLNLPRITSSDSLASTLWPACLASSILCRSPTLQEFWKDKDLLELGCGVGLTGLVAAESASSCRLSDNDNDVLTALDEEFSTNDKIRVGNIDWRDNHAGADQAGVVLSTDVAYYYFLLRPLMDTVLAHLDQESSSSSNKRHHSSSSSLWMNTGQANRQCQWMLYHNVKDGCYNQRTDQHEPAWPGQTQMLLYKLDVYEWKKKQQQEHDDDDNANDNNNNAAISNNNDTDNRVDGTIPIAVMMYQTPSGMSTPFPPLTDWDYIATKSDEDDMDMTF